MTDLPSCAVRWVTYRISSERTSSSDNVVRSCRYETFLFMVHLLGVGHRIEKTPRWGSFLSRNDYSFILFGSVSAKSISFPSCFTDNFSAEANGCLFTSRDGEAKSPNGRIFPGWAFRCSSESLIVSDRQVHPQTSDFSSKGLILKYGIIGSCFPLRSSVYTRNSSYS